MLNKDLWKPAVYGIASMHGWDTGGGLDDGRLYFMNRHGGTIIVDFSIENNQYIVTRDWKVTNVDTALELTQYFK